jgi:hypothetical protein
MNVTNGAEDSARNGTEPERKGRRGFARRSLSIVVVVAVVSVALSAPTWVGGWAPIAHTVCVDTSTLAGVVAWIPAILVNSPFGGSVAGNASIPRGFIANGQGLGSSDGMPASNGSVGGVFFHVLMNLSRASNETIWGPGSNLRCSQAFHITATVDFSGSQVFSGILLGPGNYSDSGEPHMYNFTTSSGDATVYFTNGYTTANMAPVSTCNTSGRSIPISSPELVVSVPFTIGGHVVLAPFTLPFSQTFHYYFPPNFGTWQIDNLSAPGGPGGGWAFSYAPCP